MNGELSYLVDEDSSLKGRNITQITMDPSAKAAIQGFLHELEQRTPIGIQIQSAFYPNSQACIEEGAQSDAILGYDIEDMLTEFEHLKRAKLNNEGVAIAVVKIQENGQDFPVFLAAHGPNEHLVRA